MIEVIRGDPFSTGALVWALWACPAASARQRAGMMTVPGA
jgi:hypothetical protein